MHAKAAGKTIIVAVNKCDLPAADPVRVRTQLMENDLMPTDFGGEIECVDVSAHTGAGIDERGQQLGLVVDAHYLTFVDVGQSVEALEVVVEVLLDDYRMALALHEREQALQFGVVVDDFHVAHPVADALHHGGFYTYESFVDTDLFSFAKEIHYLFHTHTAPFVYPPRGSDFKKLLIMSLIFRFRFATFAT